MTGIGYLLSYCPSGSGDVGGKGAALDCFKDCVLKERLSRPHFF